MSGRKLDPGVDAGENDCELLTAFLELMNFGVIQTMN
jgi:hypothetical protein